MNERTPSVPAYFSHYSVLLKECIEGLNIKKDGIYVDCTTGGAGHSLEILKHLGEEGLLLCFDRDQIALQVAQARLENAKQTEGLKGQFQCIHSDFSEIKSVLETLGIKHVDGILADLGVSSYQLDQADRGFSYSKNGPLDMRMDQNTGRTAADFLNQASEEALAQCFYLYGEERYSRAIAKGIVKARKQEPLTRTEDLVKVILSAIPSKARHEAQHPAKRVFQAIRIEVNQELRALETLLEDSADLLSEGGHLAIISFHSLEDRRVKEAYKTFEKTCICPRDFPICRCGKQAKGYALDKGITANETELLENPRSRSARLRCFRFEKLKA